ncbi:MAG: homoserine kinase, partial [Aquificota bacterium]
GFDAFGLALELYNRFEFEPARQYEVYIKGEGQDLPKDEGNLFIKAYKRACEFFGLEQVPLRVIQENQVPTSRGLGSSATAIVGGILACLRLHGVEKSLEELLSVAYEFEPHFDNLLPTLLGGFVVCAVEGSRVSYIKLDFPEELKVVVCVPDFELSTQRAREVVKREITLYDGVFNLQRSALLVASLLTKRFELLKEAVKDRLHQPYRAELVPGFYEVLESAYGEGALGVFLSGAGPSVASFCIDGAESVGKAMVKAFERFGARARYLLLKVSKYGAFDL